MESITKLFVGRELNWILLKFVLRWWYGIALQTIWRTRHTQKKKKMMMKTKTHWMQTKVAKWPKLQQCVFVLLCRECVELVRNSNSVVLPFRRSSRKVAAGWWAWFWLKWKISTHEIFKERCQRTKRKVRRNDTNKKQASAQNRFVHLSEFYICFYLCRVQ